MFVVGPVLILSIRCPEAQKAIGQERAKELHKLTQSFMLRRTQEVLEKFLPCKHDLVLFCKPTRLQSDLYKSYLTCEDVRRPDTSF